MHSVAKNAKIHFSLLCLIHLNIPSEFKVIAFVPMDTRDSEFDFCSDAETAFRKLTKVYCSTCHGGTCFAGIPGGTIC